MLFEKKLVVMFKNPNLLKSRLNAKEKQAEQSVVVKLSGLMFVAGFIVAGLGIRFNWYILPKGITIGAAVIFIVAYILYAEILRGNTHLSRTIEVQENQKVIDTGLYGIVRHPMYSVILLLFLSMPIVLGSVYSFLILWYILLSLQKELREKKNFLKRNSVVIVNISKRLNIV